MTNFKFGERSRTNLSGVSPRIVRIVTLALTKYSPVDFGVVEGVRSREKAYQNYGKGRTVQQMAAVNLAAKYAKPNEPKVTWVKHPLNSRHCQQIDGWGHAVDLLPTVGGYKAGRAVFQQIDAALKQAAAELGEKPLRWGGDWDCDGNVGEKGESDFVHWED